MSYHLTIPMLAGECWWGGTIKDAERMPFDEHTQYHVDLLRERRTQSAPLFLSSKGRYLWSEGAFAIEMDGGVMEIESDEPVQLEAPGSTLREAYLAAMKAHFPFESGIHTPREFYHHPQFNTWMELIKNQNEQDILAYVQEVVEHGYQPGIFIIDGGWQKCQGTWEFNRELISDPEEMFSRLHALGFQVMIWVSPFMCSEGDNFLKLYSARSSENVGGQPCYDHLVRYRNGEVAIQHWWSGFGAILNFNLPGDCEYMDGQLQKLLDMGADGFKFDGGTCLPQSFLNGTDFYGGYSTLELNQAWVRFGSRYRLHEYKDTWKMGGKPVVQRLFDKNHAWKGNGLDCLISHGIFTGLIGCPFICPDMIGGGEWTAFVYGKHDEELFIRMAEASALFPMMQFSSLPWRHLSPKAVQVCKEMAELHEQMYPEIEQALEETEHTGEPMIRSMEYAYPGCGYERINDQFLLGENILVAPVVEKGARARRVIFPQGAWQDEAGRRYEGPIEAVLEAPLEKLLWFRQA